MTRRVIKRERNGETRRRTIRPSHPRLIRDSSSRTGYARDLPGGRSTVSLCRSDGFNRKISTFPLKAACHLHTLGRPTARRAHNHAGSSRRSLARSLAPHARGNRRVSSLADCDVLSLSLALRWLAPQPTCISRRAAATSVLSELRTVCRRASRPDCGLPTARFISFP